MHTRPTVLSSGFSEMPAVAHSPVRKRPQREVLVQCDGFIGRAWTKNVMPKEMDPRGPIWTGRKPSVSSCAENKISCIRQLLQSSDTLRTQQKPSDCYPSLCWLKLVKWMFISKTGSFKQGCSNILKNTFSKTLHLSRYFGKKSLLRNRATWWIEKHFLQSGRSLS